MIGHTKSPDPKQLQIFLINLKKIILQIIILWITGLKLFIKTSSSIINSFHRWQTYDLVNYQNGFKTNIIAT